VSNESRGNKRKTEINPNSEMKYPLSINLTKSLGRFYNVKTSTSCTSTLSAFSIAQ